MASDKPLPPKLEEELNNAKFYKPSSGNQESASQRIAKVFDDSKERAMYDEILGPMLGGSSSRKPLSATPKPTSGSTMAGNVDFNNTIITRLKQVEMEAKDARSKLAHQITANEKLQVENITLRSMVDHADGALEEIADLRRHNADLLCKLAEMEAFLGDYGLVWVGKKDRHEPDDETTNVQETEESSASSDGKTTTPHSVSYSEFNFHIDELNAVIYSEPAQIITNQKKARLVQSSELLETVRIVYYKNGLMIKRGPFRYCGTSTYKSFVKDIVDGYFPSEFQNEYPDGVVFDLKDQREVLFVEGKSDALSEQSQMSRAQLLNRLPKTVIHKGQVLGVRGDIEDLLSGKAAASVDSNNISHNPHAQVALKSKVVISTPAMHSEMSSEGMGDMVQIQVKWVDQSTFIAKLYEHNTVGDLKTYILQHFEGQGKPKPTGDHAGARDIDNDNASHSHYRHGTPDGARTSTSTATEELKHSNAVGFEFELRSAYPPRALGLHLSLKEAGLTPNGTVHAKKL